MFLSFYLAQKLCFWTGIIFIRVYVSVCVCLSVCVSICISIISKSSWPILMKLGRMMYNDKRQFPFKDEINRSGRTQTSPIFLFIGLSLYNSGNCWPISMRFFPLDCIKQRKLHGRFFYIKNKKGGIFREKRTFCCADVIEVIKNISLRCKKQRTGSLS